MPTRWQSRTAGVVLALAVFGVGGCRTSGDTITAGPPTSTTTGEPDPALAGRFFVSAGEARNSDFFELRFVPVRLYQLTVVGRGGGVSGCLDRVVVSTAHQGVGLQDTLQEYSASGLGPVQGLGSPKASLPDLDPNCRLVYTEVDRSGPELVDHLVTWDPETKALSVVHSAELLGIPDWGPDGRIAVFQGRVGDEETPTEGTAIAIVSPDGSVRTVESPVPDFGTIQWGASRFMAIAHEGTGTVFLDPDSGERVDLAGWVPLAWSPDASRLLVAGAAERRRLGLVEASDLATVRPVGTAGAPVYDAEWLPAGALPDIAPPQGPPAF